MSPVLDAPYAEQTEEPDGTLSRFVMLGAGPEPDGDYLVARMRKATDVELERGAAGGAAPSPEAPMIVTLGEATAVAALWFSEVEEEVERVGRLDDSAGEALRGLAVRSDWALHLEMPVSSAGAFSHLSLQLQLVAALCDDTVRAVADTTALRLWGPDTVRDMLAVPGAPPLSNLYAAHLVGDNDSMGHARGAKLGAPGETPARRSWLHTHGLTRLGLPDLELFGVPGELQLPAQELIESVVERLVDNPRSATGTFPLAGGVRGALAPLHEVLPLLPEHAAGVAPEQRARDDTLDGHRRALVAVVECSGAPMLDWDLSEPLAEIARTGMVYRSPGSTARMQALAWQRLPMLRQIWRHHRDLGWRVLLKAPLESDQTARRQHIWYEVDELGASEVEAWPVVDAGTAEKRRPTRRHLNLSGISSFLLITPEGRWDPARLPELARRLKTPGGAS